MNGALQQPHSDAASSIVTDEAFDAAWEAEGEAFAAYMHEHAGSEFMSTTAARRHSLRAAIEAAFQHVLPTLLVTK